ncbi:MAG: hypothetical protein Q7J65_01905, partial [Candidatus Marinimicrobia bacterium]|nr:hypothetical protein [Candidatus Neomarinimicrobiota bacterium]
MAIEFYIISILLIIILASIIALSIITFQLIRNNKVSNREVQKWSVLYKNNQSIESIVNEIVPSPISKLSFEKALILDDFYTSFQDVTLSRLTD